MCVVVVTGDIDVAAERALSTALQNAVASAPAVLVDLTACTFIDSVGLGVLLTAARLARANTARLAVACLPDGAPRALFELVLGHSLFATCDDRASGIAALARPVAPTAALDTTGLLGRAVAATDSGIVIADATLPDHPLTYVNAAFEEMTGYSSDEVLGRNCRFLQGPDTDPASIALIAAALRRGRSARVVLLNNKRDGTPFFNELRLSPVRDDAGRVVQVVGVQSDVSEAVHATRARELDRDRAVAELAAFQEALTPAHISRHPGLEFGSVFLPAEQGVSGDFHLVAAGPDGSTVLVVGDAMGHGLQAARRATFVRITIATLAAFTDDPHRLLQMANHALVEKAGTSSEFVTAVCVVYDPRAGLARWASAGHPAPLDLDSGLALGGRADPSIAMGVAPELGGGSVEVELPEGRGLLLATDGLSEARQAAPWAGGPRRLGTERVVAVLRAERGRSVQLIVERLAEAARAHSGGALADDLCLVAVRSVRPT